MRRNTKFHKARVPRSSIASDDADGEIRIAFACAADASDVGIIGRIVALHDPDRPLKRPAVFRHEALLHGDNLIGPLLKRGSDCLPNLLRDRCQLPQQPLPVLHFRH